MYKFAIIIGSIIFTLAIFISLDLENEVEIDEIKIPRELYMMMNPAEKVQYKTLFKNSLDGNIADLKDLTRFNCGGAARCYTHGEMLVKIVDRIGESKALKILPSMNSQEKSYFKFLLMAGLEYGEFDKNNKSQLIEMRFPQLNKALENL